MPQFQSSHLSVNYNDAGKGNVILLIHGFGEDSSIWNSQLSFLQQNFRTITIDLPGSGASQILQRDDATIESYADVVFELLEYLQPEKTNITILGHSMGGYITLAFAQKYERYLAGLGLIHSTAFADSEEKKNNRERSIEIMAEYGAYAFLKTTIPNLFSSAFKKQNFDVVEHLIEKGQSFSVEALQQYYKAMMLRPDYTSVLKQTKLPVLFIVGTDDIAAPLNDILKQTHLPQKSLIKILENVGHMGMLENPAAINNTIATFVDSFIE